MWPANWQGMIAGDECPMCADMALPENPHSFWVAELPYSVVRLPRNQYMRGWTVVIFKRHACEMYELEPPELAGFWQDTAQVAQALNTIYRPVKINYGVFGNLCPHIHGHVLPQYDTDDPHKPINMHEQTVLWDPIEYERQIARLREALHVL